MPTACAPSTLNIRISAGVSYDGPFNPAYTPSRSVIPSARATSFTAARNSGSYAFVMSGKRVPSESSFGPSSGESFIRLMWSLITIKSPAANDGSRPPAAFVTSTDDTPSRDITRAPCTTCQIGCPS